MVTPTEFYRDVFFSERVGSLMEAGNIIPKGWDASRLLRRLLARLEVVERKFGETAEDTERLFFDLESFIRAGACILGSPLLTNVAFRRSTLTSCSAVPITACRLSGADADLAEAYYRLNMGSGYRLDDSDDPLSLLADINAHARRLTREGTCERYIGNMAHLDVGHPNILDFIDAKVRRPDMPHLNISVNVDDRFMSAVERDGMFELSDGRAVRASEIMDRMARAAWLCGDPGWICIDRFNAGNAVRGSSPYTTTAPCAEVGLAAGETCVFGYVNLAACLRSANGGYELDRSKLSRIGACLTRVLDDALEDSVIGMPDEESASVMMANRKIGVGVCGFADAVLWMGLDYGSAGSLAFLGEALDILNFSTKQASADLGRRRGAFAAFASSRYLSEPGFLERGASAASGCDWTGLSTDVRRHGLRNAMTTALPPSGRASLLLGVNASIEPFFDLRQHVHAPLLIRALNDEGALRRNADGEVQPSGRSETLDRHLRASSARSATDVSPAEHLAVLSVAASQVDDGVSKTINLPETATEADVRDLMVASWRLGLKAVSLYRAGDLPHADAVAA